MIEPKNLLDNSQLSTSIILKGLDEQCPAEMKNEDKRMLLAEEIKKSFLNDGMEIDEDDVDIRDIIGEGAFGCVNRGILLPTGKEVAVKRLKGKM